MNSDFSVSPHLLNLTISQVVQLDQEATGGEGWQYYSNGHIMKATVFQNKLSGRVLDSSHIYFVEIKANARELLAYCNCNTNGYLCKHIVALLYSWVNDREDFIDVGKSLKKLENLDKKALIEIIGRMLLNDPTNLDCLEDEYREEDYF